MTAKELATACALLIAVGTAGVACGQPAADPGLRSLNACLTGPAAGSETDFMIRLNPALNDPDRVGWCLFLYINAKASSAGNNNALFETWASDGDTFQTNPVWPAPGSQPMVLRRPILQHLTQRPQAGLGARPFVLPVSTTQCKPGELCIGEEVRRNKSTFDFIKDNKLYSQDGLKAYGKTISFPADSIEVKANWVPVSQLAQFLANSGSPADPRLYHLNTTTENGQQVQYALLSFHIISKMVPNWTWATFEHMNNPGRCDILGCYDTFGATPTSVAPADNPGKQYPNCAKSQALTALFGAASIDPAFINYCLKGTQVDFTDAQGVATRLGNSVTEQGFLDSASCMSCHGRAAYSFVTGAWSASRVFTYNSTPIGPVGRPDPGQFWLYPEKDPMRPQDAALFRPADFVWSLPFCAIDATGKSHCAAK